MLSYAEIARRNINTKTENTERDSLSSNSLSQNSIFKKHNKRHIVYFVAQAQCEFEDLNVIEFFKRLKKKYPNDQVTLIPFLLYKKLDEKYRKVLKELDHTSVIYIDAHSSSDSKNIILPKENSEKCYTPEKFAGIIFRYLKKENFNGVSNRLKLNLIICDAANLSYGIENTIAYRLCNSLKTKGINADVIGRNGEVYVSHEGRKTVADSNGARLSHGSKSKFLISHNKQGIIQAREVIYTKKHNHVESQKNNLKLNKA